MGRPRRTAALAGASHPTHRPEHPPTKKLTLNLEDLAVESFETTQPAGRRGTVRGLGGMSDTTCFQDICTCPTGSGYTCHEPTCEASCDGNCGGSGYPQTCVDTCHPADGCTGLSQCNSPLSYCVCTPAGTCINETCGGNTCYGDTCGLTC